MAITSGTFKLPDFQDECFFIKLTGSLNGEQGALLRNEISTAITNPFNVIYIDTKEVIDADLSGVNEIIHAHHQAHNSFKTLIVLYQKNSPMDKWIVTTSLDKFIATAIIP